jgi:hypothetical protein
LRLSQTKGSLPLVRAVFRSTWWIGDIPKIERFAAGTRLCATCLQLRSPDDIVITRTTHSAHARSNPRLILNMIYCPVPTLDEVVRLFA